jgi:hypothetical protein
MWLQARILPPSPAPPLFLPSRSAYLLSIMSHSRLVSSMLEVCAGSISKALMPAPSADVMKPLTRAELKSHRMEEMLAYSEMVCLHAGGKGEGGLGYVGQKVRWCACTP